MKPLICIYCEGSEIKLASAVKENDKIKLLNTNNFDFVPSSFYSDEGIADLHLESNGLELQGLNQESTLPGAYAVSSQVQMNTALKDINLNSALFIPALTEPSIYYHVTEKTKIKQTTKITQTLVDDIKETKNVTITKEDLGFVELSDESLLSVFLSGEVSCIKMINSLARYNGKRYYKIPSVKSAEVSLAYYVAKRKKFFPDDYSLIVYIGKEYSKLIFLHGRKLKHIGSTLDIGTVHLHTYDVYFSKILLEMENGGISSLDNIVVCGEDDSENLILSFYGTFPEANVSRLDFDDVDITSIDETSKEKISSFSVPIAVAAEYIDELEETYKGINLLPRYVREEQKFFQFAWHAYAMLPLLFVSTFFLTQNILTNKKTIDKLNEDIGAQTLLQRQNQEILEQINSLETKINTFDQTQAILDSATVGTEIWGSMLKRTSNFFDLRKNLWLSKLTTEDNNRITLEGYSTAKSVLTDFAYSINSAVLKGVFNETLREKNAYKFTLTFNLSSFAKSLYE